MGSDMKPGPAPELGHSAVGAARIGHGPVRLQISGHGDQEVWSDFADRMRGRRRPPLLPAGLQLEAGPNPRLEIFGAGGPECGRLDDRRVAWLLAGSELIAASGRNARQRGGQPPAGHRRA
jgi:hypothetical protein